jgi:hypothetical protein
MKKFYSATMISILLLFCVNTIKAQTTDSTLNQVELMKQFIGSWQCDDARDTIVFWETKSYGTGLECYFTYVTKGKVFQEGKQLWGYDKSIDKFIAFTLRKGMDIQIDAYWFISKNKLESLYYRDIPNLEKASLRWELEFTSSDILLETSFINDDTVKTVTFTRVKE